MLFRSLWWRRDEIDFGHLLTNCFRADRTDNMSMLRMCWVENDRYEDQPISNSCSTIHDVLTTALTFLLQRRLCNEKYCWWIHGCSRQKKIPSVCFTVCSRRLLLLYNFRLFIVTVTLFLLSFVFFWTYYYHYFNTISYYNYVTILYYYDKVAIILVFNLAFMTIIISSSISCR